MAANSNAKAVEKQGALMKLLRQFPVSAIVLSLVFAAIAAKAGSIDYANNTAFGSAISESLGSVFGLGAIALSVLPFARPILKSRNWTMALWMVNCGIAISLVVTVVAALSAHLDKQAADRMHRHAQNQAYADKQKAIAAAQRDYDKATEQADNIDEASPSETLLKLADNRDEDAKKEAGNKFCGPLCQTYQKEANAYRERAGKAKARENALARADDAKRWLEKERGGEKLAPVEVSGLVMAYAGFAGGSADDAARSVELFTAALSILLTVSLALLGEPAMLLMRCGLGMEDQPAATAKPVQPKKVAPITLTAEPAAKRGRPRIDRDERIAQFIAEKLRPGAGEAPAGAVQSAFIEWWERTCPGYGTPDEKRVARALKDAGITKRRTAAGQMYGAMLLQ